MSDEKPWEETWRVEPIVENDEDGRYLMNGTEVDNFLQGKARVSLAAAAPDMARVLSALASAGTTRPCCYVGPAEEHATDCPLVAVLRKAGVLP